MQISRLFGSTIATDANDSASKPENLDNDDFLKLLMVQLQNQDPLNPMDNAEFLSELSQFSQLEQLYNVNQGIQDLSVLQSSSSDVLLTNFLGKTAKVEASNVALKDQNNIGIYYDLKNPAEMVTINIYNENDQSHPVKTIDMIKQDRGQQQVDWNGSGNNNQRLPAGNYIIKIATNNQNSENLINPYLIGPVREVIFSQADGPLIQVEDQLVPLSKVMQIGEQVISSQP